MHKIFRNGLFPEAKSRNVLLYYLINIAMSVWFIEAVWYFYWGRFASYTLIGFIFSFTSLLQMFAIIPTGALADMFGQKKSVVVGLGLLFLGGVAIASGLTIWHLFAGLIVQSLGRAFITGALEALVFESLKKEGKTEQFSHIISFNIQLEIFVFAVTASMGGWLYSIHFRLAHILSALSSFAAFIVSLFLSEITIKKVHSDHLKTFIDHQKQGFQELWLPQMRMFLLPALTIAVLMRMYDWGISKPTIAVGFGFYSKEQSILYAVLGVMCAVIVGQIGWFKKRLNEVNGILLMGIMVCVGFVSTLIPLGMWGIVSMLSIEIGGRLSYAWVPAIVNKRISSSYRATTLSTLDFVGRIPYIGLNYLAGMAIDHKLVGQFHAIFGSIGLLLLLVWFVTAKKKNSSV